MILGGNSRRLYFSEYKTARDPYGSLKLSEI